MEKELLNQDKQIIFFDGVCGICNSSVDFLIKRDKGNVFYFSPLQSDFAKKHLSKDLTKDLNTLVFLDKDKIYTKSRAVFKILSYIKVGYWRYLKVFKILPVFLTDIIYDLVAKYRYKVFGKRETCRIPTESEKKKFLT